MIKWDCEKAKITNEEDIYAKLPNRVVWVCKDENSKLEGIMIDHSLRELINYNFTVSALYTLYTNLNLKGYTTFSIEELIEDCGYKSNKDNIKKFKGLLLQLNEMNVISNLSTDIIKAKANTYIECRLNLDSDSQYFMVYAKQYEAIFNSKYTVKEKNNSFTFLCYVLSKIKINGDFCHFSLMEASEELGINKNTILSIRDILKELNLLYFDFVGTEYNNKNCDTVYALSKENLLKGLQWSYALYSYFGIFNPKEEYKRLFERA